MSTDDDYHVDVFQRVNPSQNAMILKMDEELESLRAEIIRLRAELAAEWKKAEECEYALQDYADENNWLCSTDYGPYGSFDVWIWDGQTPPYDRAQDTLTAFEPEQPNS